MERSKKPHHGRKPKLIKDRILKPEDLKPIRRPERSWSQRQKLRVLVFLYHHRIPISSTIRNYSTVEYRAPTQLEASEIYGVPQRTISEWVRKQAQIEGIGSRIARSPRDTTIWTCQWPELESRLYHLFLSRREQGQAIRTGWFRMHSLAIFRDLHPEASYVTCLAIFRFSNGWFRGFIGRYRISLRCITKKAQHVPADYRNRVINWLQFNRRNSQPLDTHPNPGNWLETVLCRAVGRYDLCNICNLDETPLPFEYLSGRTYNLIGSKTVWVKESKSGWDKRQASLVLCIFADGVNRIPPMVLFHGEGKVLPKESPQYHPGVLVEFNRTAYMNDGLFVKYIDLYLLPALNGRPSLFAIDLCSSHKTSPVLNIFHQHKVIPTLIPAGCTSLVQPLDVSINKPLKARIRDLTDEAILECESIEEFEKWSVGQRRILTTWCVGDAWYQFCIEKQDIIKSVFRKVGLSLPIDGSQDYELDIKGFSGIEIGDWRRSEVDQQDPGMDGDLQDSGTGGDLDILFGNMSTEHDNCDFIEFVADGE